MRGLRRRKAFRETRPFVTDLQPRRMIFTTQGQRDFSPAMAWRRC